MCFGLILISAAPPLPWSGLIPLVRSAVRCSFGVHRAPLPALVCFVERPAVRCCPLRFVLYACIVKHILYKDKRKIYKLLRFVKYVYPTKQIGAVCCVNCTLYKVQEKPGAVFTM